MKATPTSASGSSIWQHYLSAANRLGPSQAVTAQHRGLLALGSAPVDLEHVDVDDVHLAGKRRPQRGADCHVGSQDVLHVLHHLILLQDVHHLAGLRDDVAPRRVRRRHQHRLRMRHMSLQLSVSCL